MTTPQPKLTIETVKEEWKQDSPLDELRIDYELTRIPSLHSKYLSYYVFFKQALADAKLVHAKMGNVKLRYYKGECTKQELDTYKWQQFQGLKAGIGDMKAYFEWDLDMNLLKKEILKAESAVDTCEYILKEIDRRGYHLRTLLDYQKYINGA